jgi:hypothetical protein
VWSAILAWSLPLARVSTYDDFVVVVVAAPGATPIVLHRSDQVRVHKTRQFGTFGTTMIDLQPAHRPWFLLRITPRHRDTIALESALHYSLDSGPAGRADGLQSLDGFGGPSRRPRHGG